MVATSPLSLCRQESLECPDDILGEVSSLDGMFQRLVSNIVEALKEAVNDTSTLIFLAKTIKESCGIGHDPLTGTETVDDICFPITRNKNCFDPNPVLLYKIDGAIFRRRFRKDIRSFCIALREFLKSTTIATFTERVKSHYKNWNTIDNVTEIIVVIRVSRIYGNEAVDLINHLKKTIFSEYSSIMVLYRIFITVF